MGVNIAAPFAPLDKWLNLIQPVPSFDLGGGCGPPPAAEEAPYTIPYLVDPQVGGRKRFLSGTILVRDSEAGVGTELAVVQKYGRHDSGTTEHLPSPA